MAHSLRGAYTDLILSRQAMNGMPPTMFFYNHIAGVLLAWVEQQGVIRPDEISPRYIRQYIAEGRLGTEGHC